MMIRRQLQTIRKHANKFTWEMTPKKRADKDREWRDDTMHANDITGPEKHGSIYYLFVDKGNCSRVTLLRQNRETGFEIANIFAPEELFNETFHEDAPKLRASSINHNSNYIEWLCAQLDDSCQAPNVFH